MGSMVELFKNHWFFSMIGICAGVAVATWGLATILIERPLRAQLDITSAEMNALEKQLSFLSAQRGQSESPPFRQSTTDVASWKPIGVGIKQKDEQSADTRSCTVLESGNKLYVERKWPEAINAYLKVQEFDKFGKSSCVAPIYASLATIYGLMGEAVAASNTQESSEKFRLASKYNRAFATALMCQRGDCTASADLWSTR